MPRLHKAGVGSVQQHAPRPGAGRHQARIHHLQVTHIAVPIIVTAHYLKHCHRYCDGTLNIDLFRLRASDADDDYPLKFSIQGEDVPYILNC